jgi:hypothetical protein
MTREEMFAHYLKMLDDTNRSIHLALETLSKNAAITRLVMEELMYGCAEAPSSCKPDFLDHFDDRDENEKLADQIVSQIQESHGGESGIRVIDLPFNPEKVDLNEVMKLVRKKLEGTSKEEPKEDFQDDIDFDNPLA